MKMKSSIRMWGWLLLFAMVMGGPPSHLQAAQGQTAESLKITEIYYDTPGADAEEEWIELANFGSGAVELSSFKIGDEESRGGGEGMVQFPEGSFLEPGQTAIVAQSAVGFQRLFGFSPTFEINDSQPSVPDMGRYFLWASGEVGLANDGDEVLLLDEEDVVVDAVAFGETGESVPGAFRPPTVPGIIRGQSIERVPAGCDTDTAVDWLPQTFPTPGRLTLEGECRPSSNPEPELLLPIGEIQGRGETAELLNQVVTFQGVVTGWIEDQNVAGTRFYTIFVQDVQGTADGDPLTSDGIAVFLGVNRPSVQRGDLVLITGQVTEFFGLTEIDDNGLELSVVQREQPLPEPIPLQPPSTDEAGYFEPLEGMLVSLETAVVVGATFSGCGLAAAPPGPADHYFRHHLSDPAGPVINILHTSDVSCGDFPAVQVGDRLTGLSGPLHFHFDQYKIVNQDAADLEIESDGLPELRPPLAAGASQITIASLNLHDYFDTIDDTGDEAEPKPAAAELAVKQAKLIYGVGRSLGCPTIIGVQEVENAALLRTLAEGLVESCGFTYQVTHLESADGRGIDVALLSDPRQVNILGAGLRQSCSPIDTDVLDSSIDCPAGQSPLFSRPPLQVEAAVEGQTMILFVNHFKSKREGETETAPRRLAQGAHIRNLVEQMTAVDETARIVVMGDFNDFARSPVMEAMTAEGLLVNVLMDGPAPLPPEEQYTYIFGGLAQLIDGFLLSPSLAALVADTMILRANADFPYTLAIDTSEAGLPFFFSDHDVPLLLLNLEPEPVPTEEPADPTPTVTALPSATAIPAAVPEGGNDSTVMPLVLILGLVGGTAVIAVAVFAVRRRS
jgi:hypothetical protein